ncbi:MAG: hypothetical protein Q4D29_04495 [Lachnospiraceae bacterium]|nr:hypothetical protein [Lachnospiraceae bacterium]
MKELLYYIVELIAKIHTKILTINDKYEYELSDKTLHFLVIGFLGLALVFVIHPVFKMLAKKGHVMVITWIYVFTLIVVITFAIEIGQKVTNTGYMEFADIMYGIVGFFYMFFVFALFRSAYHGILKLINYEKQKKHRQ